MKKMEAFRGVSVHEQILDPNNQDIKSILESPLFQITHKQGTVSFEDIEFTRILNILFKPNKKIPNKKKNSEEDQELG
jgi:hypothetical protein